jgi:hypothetical protein
LSRNIRKGNKGWRWKINRFLLECIRFKLEASGGIDSLR